MAIKQPQPAGTPAPITPPPQSAATPAPVTPAQPVVRAERVTVARSDERAARAGQRPAMLTIRQVTYKNLTWIDIQRPGRAELDWLRSHYSFHPLHLEDVMSKIQRPKLDERDDYLFAVMHFPVYNKITRLTTASEVDVFIGEHYVITVHAGHLRPILRLFQQCLDDEDMRARVMRRSSGYLFYAIIDRLVDYCFPILNKIDLNIEKVEDLITADNSRETVFEISIVRRDIIAYRRIIKPQIGVIAGLERRANAFERILGEDMGEYFSDLGDHLSKIWDTLEDYKEVIDGLSATNDSLTNTRINEIIKLLTILSVLLLPLSVVTGLMGMNVHLPLQDEPIAFWMIIGFMILVTIGMLGYFRIRRIL